MKKPNNLISANKNTFLNALFVLLALAIVAVYLSWEQQSIRFEWALALVFKLSFLAYLFVRIYYLNPLKSISNVLKSAEDQQGDEVETFIESHKLMQQNINAATDFIRKIESGNLDEAYAETTHDELGVSLLSMRDHLKQISAQEQERIWVSEGLAKFSELLRAGDADLHALCLNVLSHLIKYINANQGALFLIQDSDAAEEAYMEVVACYAYDRKKYQQKRILKGEGLAGQAWIEQDKLYLTDVPQDYVAITSGLGKANPTCILIVPLKVNDEVFGVMELASFSMIPAYKVEFIEKLADSLASTVSMVKVNEQTRRLLEESQQLTEQMRAQEEEMRQNVEELSATQEELHRKEAELDRKLREALAEIELGQINQQMNEIALQIEHAVDSCKRDLKFLSNVPPVQGLVRAMANNNYDSQSSSTYDSWIERMDTIFSNFLLNKELFQSISFTNDKGRIVFELSYRGGEIVKTLESGADYQDQEVFINTSRLQPAEVYVGNMKSLADHTLIMEFGTPVFNDQNVLKGAILVNLFAKSIIEGVKSKEEGEHKYGLFTSEGVCIYGSEVQAKAKGLKKTVVTNQKQNLSLTIMHQ